MLQKIKMKNISKKWPETGQTWKLVKKSGFAGSRADDAEKVRLIVAVRGVLEMPG